MKATLGPVPRMSAARRFAAVLGAACLCVSALLLDGCHKPPAPADAPPAPDSKAPTAAASEGVSLSPDQVEKMGIETSIAKAASYAPEAAGYAMVTAHETIAQGVADLVSAIAVERQSRAALARAQRLAGTPGAMPADAQESAMRQAAVDQAALVLARQRLTAILGQKPPWKDSDNAMLDALGSGEIKLVRATFPLGAVDGKAPASLRLARINAGSTGKSWKTSSVWAAPADPTVPGRSFFTVLKGSDANEGERLLAWAPVGASEAGVLVPAACAVISDDKYWCYVQRKPGLFVRIEIDASMPLEEGYFVKQGVASGDAVVTASAGLLLAREMNSGAAAE